MEPNLVLAQEGCSASDPRNVGNPQRNLNKSSWTHYLYTVRFEDGSYYVGVSQRKGDDPLTDGYFGSPKTNAEKWSEPHVKELSALLFCETLEEAYGLETQFQRLVCNLNSPLCLNEHVGCGFSSSSQKKSVETQVERKVGIHSAEFKERHQKVQSENGKQTHKRNFADRTKAAEKYRKEVVLTNPETGEVKRFDGTRVAAEFLACSPSAIACAARAKRSCKKWGVCYAPKGEE